MLNDQRRQQLDQLVIKMRQNKESDSSIQFVVDDFKSKYNEAEAAPQVEGAQGGNFFTKLVRDPINTLVVRPATRATQAVISPFQYGSERGATKDYEGKVKEHDKIMEKWRNEKDPAKKEALRVQAMAALNKSSQAESEAARVNKRGQALDTSGQNISIPGLGTYSNNAPKNVKQVVGEGIESASTIASLSAPVGKIMTAPGKMLSSTMAKKALLGGALGAGFAGSQALKEDKSMGDVAKSAAIGLGLGATLPVVTKAASNAVGYVTSRFPKLLSIITGEDTDVISAAMKNPQIADKAIKNGDEALRNAVAKAADQSTKIRGDFISSHAEAKDKIIGTMTKKIASRKDVVNSFQGALKNQGVKIKDDVLDFTTSKIKANPGEVSKVEAAYKAIQNWKDWTPNGVDELKQLVGRYTRFPNEGGGSSKSPMLGNFYNYLNSKIKSGLPQSKRSAYEELNRKFSENIGLMDDMVDAFNSGDPFSRVANAFGNNKDSLRQIINFYVEHGGDDIMATGAGRQLAMEKSAAFGIMNPRSWIDFFYSPAAQGRTVTALPKLKQSLSKVITPNVVNTLRRVGRPGVGKTVGEAAQ